MQGLGAFPGAGLSSRDQSSLSVCAFAKGGPGSALRVAAGFCSVAKVDQLSIGIPKVHLPIADRGRNCQPRVAVASGARIMHLDEAALVEQAD